MRPESKCPDHSSRVQLFRYAHSLHANTNAQKLKVVQKFFGWAWSKYGFGQSGFWALKLAVSQERTD